MIILPTTTPAAVIDQSSVNQSQQQQVSSAEQSRKATVTVQLSSEARELAGAENKEAAPQQKAEIQLRIEAHADKLVNLAAEAQKQQPINETTNRPENNKIDIVV